GRGWLRLGGRLPVCGVPFRLLGERRHVQTGRGQLDVDAWFAGLDERHLSGKRILANAALHVLDLEAGAARDVAPAHQQGNPRQPLLQPGEVRGGDLEAHVDAGPTGEAYGPVGLHPHPRVARVESVELDLPG